MSQSQMLYKLYPIYGVGKVDAKQCHIPLKKTEYQQFMISAIPASWSPLVV